MKHLAVLLGVAVVTACATSWNFQDVVPFAGDPKLCGPPPTPEEIRAAAQEFIDGNFKYPEAATVSPLGDRAPEPVEFVFVHGEESVYAWRAWVRITRKISAGGSGYTGAQEYSFAIRNGLRIASWYPATTYQGDGGMLSFSFAPLFDQRDGR